MSAVSGGCTAPALPAPEKAATIPAHGKIIAMRAISALPPGSADAVSQILAGLAGPTDPLRQPMIEFIVHVDDGKIISIVQSDPGGLRAGADVAIIRGTRTRLLRGT